jgi:trimeric autotransporter adhesin
MVPGINVVQSGHSGVVDGPDDNSSGAAYVFVRSGTTWTEQANFKASNVGKHDWFGIRLHLSGDGNALAVGAPNEDSAAQGINSKQDDDSADEAGAVYLFRRSGATWSQQVYFKGSNTEKYDEFGSAVALSRDGRTMAVGAHFESSGAKGIGGNQADNSASQAGAVYVYVR